MKCVTGKTVYETAEIAEEALIQNHIRNNHRVGSGPINIYECRDCHHWHFTSQGNLNQQLENPEVIQRIKQERRVREWEFKLK
ncbi:MAG: hypothetical protein AB8B73_06565 [Ekhidna sp.]